MLRYRGGPVSVPQKLRWETGAMLTFRQGSRPCHAGVFAMLSGMPISTSGGWFGSGAGAALRPAGGFINVRRSLRDCSFCHVTDGDSAAWHARVADVAICARGENVS